jgi:hypothetical protein
MQKIIYIISLLFLVASCKKNNAIPPVVPPSPPPQNTKTPKLTTNPVSNLTSFSAVFGGKLVDTGGSNISRFGIVADTVHLPTIGKNYNQFPVSQLGADGSFSILVGYMPSNTTFYLRAYAINSTDTGYGNEVKFTTLTQKIYKGDVNLTTQQEAIDFGSQHYTGIDGALNISGTVSDLSSLLGLTSINNGFMVNNSQLSNFKGLDSLEVTGAVFPNGFFVQQNASLLNFAGLSKLKSTRGAVGIDHNNQLTSLKGLDNFAYANLGAVRIGECPLLQSLDGLNNLSYIGQNLEIVNNATLNDIRGLSGLKKIEGSLVILNNSLLPNLNGLEQITLLPNGVSLSDNPVLQDISALRNITDIKSAVGFGGINISNNPVLTDLSAFSQIKSIDNISIRNSPGLKSLKGFQNLQSITLVLHLENNTGLTDMTGLDNLQKLGSLELSDNPNIVNLKGFNSLTNLTRDSYSIAIERNSSLASLSGLDNLVSAKGMIDISFNTTLTNFCPLKKLFSSGFSQTLVIDRNAANPTPSQIISNCP